jgi:hypothetical protein
MGILSTQKAGYSMSKNKMTRTSREGRFVWRDSKDGKIRGVEIVRPAKGPSNTSIAEIRRAIRETNGARKEK